MCTDPCDRHRCAECERQFVEGEVQHWGIRIGRGVRTHCYDTICGCRWRPALRDRYGDTSILEDIALLEGAFNPKTLVIRHAGAV